MSTSHNKWFLFDDLALQSVFIKCSGWDEAERVARDENLTLFGEYTGTRQQPMWLTYGETMH